MHRAVKDRIMRLNEKDEDEDRGRESRNLISINYKTIGCKKNYTCESSAIAYKLCFCVCVCFLAKHNKRNCKRAKTKEKLPHAYN